MAIWRGNSCTIRRTFLYLETQSLKCLCSMDGGVCVCVCVGARCHATTKRLLTTDLDVLFELQVPLSPYCAGSLPVLLWCKWRTGRPCLAVHQLQTNWETKLKLSLGNNKGVFHRHTSAASSAANRRITTAIMRILIDYVCSYCYCSS
jgi:hypothetical protein